MAFTASQVSASGRSWASVYLDPSFGTKIATLLTDATTTFTANSSFTFKGADLAANQNVLCRQIIAGFASGSTVLAVSNDDGATWQKITTSATPPVTALCADTAYSSTNFPHAYAGDSAGKLHGITDQQNYAGVTVTTYSPTFGTGGASSITALAQPPGGHGIVWVGCADGTLYTFNPLSPGSPVVMATFAGAVTALAHMKDPTVCYGISADPAVGLFMAVENPFGCTVLSLDRAQTYHALSCVGRRALLACGSVSVVWSPDGGGTLGTAPSHGTAPFLGCALGGWDPNEWAFSYGTTVARTQANGQSYLSNLTASSGVTLMTYDPLYQGIGYGILSNKLYISYDNYVTLSLIAHLTGVSAYCLGPLVNPTAAASPIAGMVP